MIKLTVASRGTGLTQQDKRGRNGINKIQEYIAAGIVYGLPVVPVRYGGGAGDHSDGLTAEVVVGVL